MNGISGYISIMTEPKLYLNLTKLGKLKHDLFCLEMAGFSGSGKTEKRNGIVADRQFFINETNKMIIKEIRILKLEKLF